MARIKFRTKKISSILITLLVIGALMLVTGGVMLSCYSSSEPAVTPEPTAKEALSTPSAFQVTELVINPGEIGEPTELSDFKTTEPESAVPSCCANSSEITVPESAVPSCCANNSEITVPEPTVPSCCGG
ncbi:hypothetical protein ES708_04703 [subsurface metagenome]